MGPSIDCPARRRLCALGLAAGAAAAWPIRARAAAFPSRTVHLVIGQAAGGQTDTIARMVAVHFGSRWGSSVVVENLPGAGGLIAGRAVARSVPDGHTLYIGASSNIAWSALQSPDAGYDPRVAWAPVGRIVRLGFVLAVRPDLDVASVREFAARTSAKPESLTVASQGENSNSGRALRMFEQAIGAKVLEVPYKATAQSVQAVVAGEVDAAFCDLSTALAKGDRLRLLGQTASRRSPLAPDLATFKEQGFQHVVLEPWYGLVAPAGTPPDAVTALSVALRAFLTDERVVANFRSLGYEIIHDTPDEFAAAIRDELRPTGFAAGTPPPVPRR